ncbi:hypothetical protein ILYODFUR_006673 [Ilyodon furcidens]|uniref:Uncharacterized protein n=1 Tax=Ilyodon furcidens TaxID=33524 RepID=A0ABV0TTM7_9TELE
MKKECLGRGDCGKESGGGDPARTLVMEIIRNFLQLGRWWWISTSRVAGMFCYPSIIPVFVSPSSLHPLNTSTFTTSLLPPGGDSGLHMFVIVASQQESAEFLAKHDTNCACNRASQAHRLRLNSESKTTAVWSEQPTEWEMNGVKSFCPYKLVKV